MCRGRCARFIVVLLVMAVASAGQSRVHAASAGQAGPPIANLPDALLSLDDLPPGWQQLPADAATNQPEAIPASSLCGDPATPRDPVFFPPPGGSLSTGFEQATGGQVVVQQVMWFPPGAGARGFVGLGPQVYVFPFPPCRWTRTGTDGQSYEWEARELPAALAGIWSPRYLATFRSPERSGQVEIVLIPRGDIAAVLHVITFEDSAIPTDPTLMERLMRRVDERLVAVLGLELRAAPYLIPLDDLPPGFEPPDFLGSYPGRDDDRPDSYFSLRQYEHHNSTTEARDVTSLSEEVTVWKAEGTAPDQFQRWIASNERLGNHLESVPNLGDEALIGHRTNPRESTPMSESVFIGFRIGRVTAIVSWSGPIGQPNTESALAFAHQLADRIIRLGQ